MADPLGKELTAVEEPLEVLEAERLPVAHDELQADVARAAALAKLMDSQVEVMGIKFGADAVLGLVPGIGDAVAMAISCYPIHLARKHDLGRVVQARMAKNVLIDGVVGIVPLVGDIFDVVFKANIKNVRLLEKAVAERQRKGQR